MVHSILGNLKMCQITYNNMHKNMSRVFNKMVYTGFMWNGYSLPIYVQCTQMHIVLGKDNNTTWLFTVLSPWTQKQERRCWSQIETSFKSQLFYLLVVRSWADYSTSGLEFFLSFFFFLLMYIKDNNSTYPIACEVYYTPRTHTVSYSLLTLISMYTVSFY